MDAVLDETMDAGTPPSKPVKLTTVTGVVIDRDGVKWINCGWKAVLVGYVGAPPIYIQDGTRVPTSFNGTVDSTGHFTGILPANDTMTPPKTRWRITFYPLASCAPSTFDLAVTGATQAIDTIITQNIIPPRFKLVPGQFGYSDIEVSPAPTAGTPAVAYANTTTGNLRIWNGTKFVDVAQGSLPTNLAVVDGNNNFSAPQTFENNIGVQGDEYIAGKSYLANGHLVLWDRAATPPYNQQECNISGDGVNIFIDAVNNQGLYINRDGGGNNTLFGDGTGGVVAQIDKQGNISTVATVQGAVLHATGAVNCDGDIHAGGGGVFNTDVYIGGSGNFRHHWDGASSYLYSGANLVVTTNAGGNIIVTDGSVQGTYNGHAATIGNNCITIGQRVGSAFGTTAEIRVDNSIPRTFLDSWGEFHINDRTPTTCTVNGQLVVYGNLSATGTKPFIIQHPLHPEKSLVHACIEGPESGVYYRGEDRTDSQGLCTITLPDYFEALTSADNRTVLLTVIDTDTDAKNPIPMLAASRVKDGAFRVRSDIEYTSFFWEVKAVRKDIEPLEVEPARVEAHMPPAEKAKVKQP